MNKKANPTSSISSNSSTSSAPSVPNSSSASSFSYSAFNPTKEAAHSAQNASAPLANWLEAMWGPFFQAWQIPFQMTTSSVGYENFGILWLNNTFVFPTHLAQLLTNYSVHNIQEFMRLLQDYPQSLAEDLGWSVEEVVKARENLLRTMQSGLSPASEKFDKPHE